MEFYTLFLLAQLGGARRTKTPLSKVSTAQSYLRMSSLEL
jgi:hypothetical protein